MSISKVRQQLAGNFGFDKTSGIGYRTKFPRTAVTADVPLPSDWLTISEPAENEAFYGTYAVHNGDSNFVAFTVSGAYTVNWGDGVTENFAAGATAAHNYSWSSISSLTLTSGGFRQALIKITPQSGSHLTSINLQVKHPSYTVSGNTAVYNAPWLNIYVKDNTLLQLNLLQISALTNLVYLGDLKKFVMLGGAVVSMSNMFYNCSSLQSVSISYAAAVTTMASMFYNCYSLQSVSLSNTAAVTNMSSMFYNCYSLQSVPLFNTAAVANMSTMFQACYSLQSSQIIPSISLTYAGAKLSATELNRIYTSLPSRLVRSASSASGNGTLVTYTTTVAHGYIPGQVVTVTGFTPTGYNLVSGKIKTTPTATTFTLAGTTTGTSTGTGTVTPAALTLTVSNNWGTATDDPTIATAKGWTVTG